MSKEKRHCRGLDHKSSAFSVSINATLLLGPISQGHFGLDCSVSLHSLIQERPYEKKKD